MSLLQKFTAFIQNYQESNDQAKDDLLKQFFTQYPTLPLVSDTNDVIFVYFTEHSITNCQITGDIASWSKNGIRMKRLDIKKSFFYHIMAFEPSARIEYKFIVDGEWILDPRNPRTVNGGYGPNSEVALPSFHFSPEIEYHSSIPHGEIHTLNVPWNGPHIQIYLPPNYNSTTSYPVFFAADGSDYITLGNSTIILDNLIAEQRIVPVIGVFTDPSGARAVWYKCNPDFLAFIDQLVPFIDKNYSTSQKSQERLLFGDSLGALAAFYVLHERPLLFQNIGSHSGAFWGGEDYSLKERLRKQDNNPPVKLWFSAGTYEPRILSDTKLVEAICKRKGWEVRSLYLFEGHSWGTWRHTIIDMFEYFYSTH